MIRRALLLGGLIILAQCGKEVGRVPLSGEGSGATSTTLKAGEVAMWTDLDIEWQGDGALAYDVELVQGGTKVATATCDPLGNMSVKTGWVETNIGTSHSRRGNGKMSCQATLPAGGPTTINVKLAFSKKPTTVTIKKADLAVRQ